MNYYEQFAVTIFHSLIARLHLNPIEAASLAKVLIAIRDGLNALYPPTPPVVQ